MKILFVLANFILLSCTHQKSKQSEALVNRISFPSSKEALVYILERKLQIQRLYENTSEPYFGKPEEKKCRNNVDLDGKLQKASWGRFIYLQILVNDYLAIGDCMLENNTKKALYEFYLCNNEVLELRSYTDINGKLPKAPTSMCGN
ncbi:MAG: hypothetical protein H7281_13185 [Bacteriovorax sp.]|nr:hypothetical protein [Bacteriovorax sp.]